VASSLQSLGAKKQKRVQENDEADPNNNTITEKKARPAKKISPSLVGFVYEFFADEDRANNLHPGVSQLKEYQEFMEWAGIPALGATAARRYVNYVPLLVDFVKTHPMDVNTLNYKAKLVALPVPDFVPLPS